MRCNIYGDVSNIRQGFPDFDLRTSGVKNNFKKLIFWLKNEDTRFFLFFSYDLAGIESSGQIAYS